MTRAHAGAVETPDLLGGDELAIARSVLYASLFDYPLTLAQLRQTLIERVLTPSEIIATYRGSIPLQSAVEWHEGFFFPRGRSDLIDERRRREARSRAFLADHRRLLTLICAIPFVRLVALSGSIAHLNLEGGGDLDLFIVTRGRRVWSVTVALVLLAKLMRVRRFVCANYVVSDAHLRLDQEDLFSASQIIHLKPLIGDEVYRQLVAENHFIHRFYPNFHSADGARFVIANPTLLMASKRVAEVLLRPVAGLFERICRSAYRAYLLRRAGSWRSPEQVRLEKDCLKLHTQSHRQSILDRFRRSESTLGR